MAGVRAAVSAELARRGVVAQTRSPPAPLTQGPQCVSAGIRCGRFQDRDGREQIKGMCGDCRVTGFGRKRPEIDW